MQVTILLFKLTWDGGEFSGKSKCLSKLVLSFGNYSIIVFLLSLIFMLDVYLLQNCVLSVMRRKRVYSPVSLVSFCKSLLAQVLFGITHFWIHQFDCATVVKVFAFKWHSEWFRFDEFFVGCFCLLWTIWTYRNKVVHQGLNPNPVEVILIAQNFSYRYKNFISRCNTSTDKERKSTRSEGLSATNHQDCRG